MERTVFIIAVTIAAAMMVFHFEFSGSAINMESGKENEEITVPVRAHIVYDDSGDYTSFRDASNILEIFRQANRIWMQAGIRFHVEDIVITDLGANDVPSAINGNYRWLASKEEFDAEKINVFFVQSLNGLNGLAAPEIKSAMVSDMTTVNDFRALAHEMGHLLGLRHVKDPSRLMARGENGERLSEKEISDARKAAEKMLL